MLPVLTLGREGGGAEVAQELNNLSVFFHVFFKVSRMPELPVAVRASEPVRGSD